MSELKLEISAVHVDVVTDLVEALTDEYENLPVSVQEKLAVVLRVRAETKNEML